MTGHALDIGIGIVEVMIAAYVLKRLWRFRRGFPWLIAPTGFFLLRGVDRIGAGLFGEVPGVVGLLLDPLILAVLVLLLFSIERIVSSLAAAEDAAVLREREYARALVDYRRLARHRLATPVTSIVGAARFLLELGPEDQKLRADLVQIMEDAAARLERVSLGPRTELEASERSLRPTPSLERDSAQQPSRP
jgi:signal transduction histidine kinase